MASIMKVVLTLSVLFCLTLSSSAQNCSTYTFRSNEVFGACNDLPYLNSFLHWSYNSSSSTLQIAYRHTGVSSSNWVAWAINPNGSGMVGSQALIAYQQPDGTMKAYTSSVDNYRTQLSEGKLSFDVSDLSATYADNEITIFATLGLSSIGGASNVTHVWQDGSVSGGTPRMHAMSEANMQSVGIINFLSGEVRTNPVGNIGKLRKRNVHGILNAVSWGIMMPLGALIARYLKVFKSANPAWFYLHVSCQSTAYIVGVAGWATGIKLGSESAGVVYSAHRTIGIILFALGTLQVFALLLRPKPDHKYRFYWNFYHHSVGYAVIILSIINVLKGIDILQPEKDWKYAYIRVIAAFAFNALWLEGYTWYIVLKRKRSEVETKMPHNSNGSTVYSTEPEVLIVL
ncbi:hypothetical protein K2173_025763 [Erythroxylum novogranatense]|uniref:Cytochrome b561 and DOMON domain-containing protein n=1 Tax=Erythroxylum novogranatense TaxID=1862640 RepID=A0AAV8T3T8_9ROSI|nr:hypothetical protein K2173_025763 [Erythroxylum novogranatense]